MATRCTWPGTHDDYVAYHDDEWGRPTTDPHKLFEKVCLEGFQSGLSWLTILRKRDRFREVFAGFDYEVVAAYDASDVDRLLGDAGIIRHEGKIRATINNAQRALELEDHDGSFVDWFWRWAVAVPRPRDEPIPGSTPRSRSLAHELKRRGWRFFGPTTAYAFMQSEGLVNDHDHDCLAAGVCERDRQAVLSDLAARGIELWP